MTARRDSAALARRAGTAFRHAGVIRAMPPATLVRTVRTARSLPASPATSIAIAAVSMPRAVAVHDESDSVTWATLDMQACALARLLRDQLGAGPGRPVAIMCRNHHAVFVALAAAARTGADILAVNTEFAAPQIAAALGRSDAAAILHDDEFTPRLEASGDPTPALPVWADGGSALGDQLSGIAPLREPPGRRSQITILTSGTTGTPKAAPRDIPARAMLGAAITLIEHLGLRRGDPVLIAPPLFHGFGLGVASIAQMVGAPVVVRRQFDPGEVLELIERHRVTTLIGVPVMLQRILSAAGGADGGRDLGSLRSALTGGAPLAPSLSDAFMDRFGEILHNGYGSTETGFGAIAGPADLRRAPGTVGRAPLGARIAVLDDARQPAPVNTTGHIFVGGELTIDGYADGSTKEVATGLMNTGDLGHLDDHGCVIVSGREDDMIVSGGENVFPQEVEHALAAHPTVLDVAVLGVPDDEFGQRLVAYVVAIASAPACDAELLAYLRTRLERYKLPREIVFVNEIPRTPTGKVLRGRLT